MRKIVVYLVAGFAWLGARMTWAQTYTITTVAGGGNSDPAKGGAAISSLLGNPSGIAVDQNGNLYVAASNAVYKVTPSGAISAFAGIEFSIGYSGDGGPATSATLSFITAGLAVDTAQNVYIADYVNGRIRKVGTNGIISTVAGGGTLSSNYGDNGPATSAYLFGPAAVALDAAGNLYIADESGNRIRKVSPTGTITTFAGGGSPFGSIGDGGPATSAFLASPEGVAVDGSGNVYIADTQDKRIRKVTPDGTISTFAGDGEDYSGDGGPATQAGLSGPSAVAVDTAGNVYIADDNRIRRVGLDGTITAIAGVNGINGFSGDGGPATSASLNTPEGIAIGPGGAIYVADFGNLRVRLLTPTPTSPAGPPTITGVSNAAGGQAGVVPDSFVSIYGSGFTTLTLDTWSNSITNGQLPTQLDGVSVMIGGQPAYINAITPGQINVQAPDVPLGNASVTVTNANGASAAFTTTVQLVSPALFPWPNNQPVATHTDFSIAAANGTFSGQTTVPAKPGEIIVLWGTGFGPTTPAVPAGQVPGNNAGATINNPVSVTLDGTGIQVLSSALSGFPGEYQIAVQVPASTANGSHQLIATSNGVSSPIYTLTVQQ